MATVTPVDSTDPRIKYECPTDALTSGWTTWGNDPTLYGASQMATRGNGCTMEFTFEGTGVAVLAVVNSDRGVFSCSVDNSQPVWFNAWSYGLQSNKTLCSALGLQNSRHTIRLTNGPVHSWFLSVDWIRVETNGQTVTSGGSPSITSEMSPYQMPPSLLNATGSCSSSFSPVSTIIVNVPTSTTTALAVTSGVPTGTVVGISVALAVIAVTALALAGFIFRRSKHWKAKARTLEQELAAALEGMARPYGTPAQAEASPITQTIATPTPYLTFTSPSGNQSGEYDPYESISSGSSPAPAPPPSYSGPFPTRSNPRRKS